VLVGVGYFLVWTAFGVIAFPLGVAVTTIEMQQPALSRAVPIAIAITVVVAGLMQFSAWKLRHLACCRELPVSAGAGVTASYGETLQADPATAVRHGVRLGLHCAQCCANLMVILLIIGVMDIRVMAVVAAAIAAERLAPAGEPTARAIGAAAAATGVFLIARASGLA
jgi:predicted metal-binding membrane protein